MNRPMAAALTLVGILIGGDEALGARPANAHEIDVSGSWVAPCRKSSHGEFIEERVDFRKKQTFRHERWRFADSECARETLGDTRILEGRYEVVGTGAGNARKVDFTVDKVFFTAYSPTSLKRFRDTEFCRLSDWTAGQRLDVTGLACEGESLPSGTVVPELVERAGSDQLFFAAQSYFQDDRYRKSRPDRLDRQVMFVKAPVLSE